MLGRHLFSRIFNSFTKSVATLTDRNGNKVENGNVWADSVIILDSHGWVLFLCCHVNKAARCVEGEEAYPLSESRENEGVKGRAEKLGGGPSASNPISIGWFSPRPSSAS